MKKYKVRVTLVPTNVPERERKYGTAVMQTVEVNALSDHMAGQLASATAEDIHIGYQAIMYEVL